MPRATGDAGADPSLVFVDSGAWIAWMSPRDAHHADTDRLLRHALASRIPLLTTNLVVAEVHRFLLFRAGIRAAAQALDRMARSTQLTIEFATASHHERTRFWIAKLDDQRLTYADAVSFAVMEAKRCRTVLGFDHHFALARFAFWQIGR